jgi:hypothetical protein
VSLKRSSSEQTPKKRKKTATVEKRRRVSGADGGSEEDEMETERGPRKRKGTHVPVPFLLYTHARIHIHTRCSITATDAHPEGENGAASVDTKETQARVSFPQHALHTRVPISIYYYYYYLKILKLNYIL